MPSENAIYDAGPRKKKYYCFFRRAPEISRKYDFYTNIFDEQWRIKKQKKKQKQETMYFENAKCRMLYGRSNITVSFTEHLNCQEETTFTFAIYVDSHNSKQKNQNQENIYFKKLMAPYGRGNITASFTEHLKFQD